VILSSGSGWNITRELTDIKSRLEIAGSSKPRITLGTLGTPQVIKPLLIGKIQTFGNWHTKTT
jgi:hypothetical protein